MRPCAFAFLLAALPCAAAEVLSLTSPSGRIAFRLTGGERLEYSITLSGQPAIESSPLGITVDGVDLGAGAKAGKPARYRVNDRYPWYGNHATASSRCNGARVPLGHDSTNWTLDVRACDDGVAFRYLVPGAGSRIPDEVTAFRIPASATVWYHDLEGHYEALHQRRRMDAIPAGQWAAPPVTARLPQSGYLSITEGALLHYAGMALQADGNGALLARLGHAHPVSYPFRLRYKDDIARVSQAAAVTGPITTPWRIVLLGSDLNALVNADLVHAVAPPPDKRFFPAGLRTPWVKPGRAVWRYLDGGDNTPAGLKEFSRLAGQLGFEYQVVEGMWSRWTEADLRDFIDYSRRQGVGIWLWKHSRDLRTPEGRKRFFDLARSAGAAGAKIDFFDHEAKEVVELYEVLLRDAAEHRLLVNFHGANKPTGESRTWPNELTREGVRGMESSKTDRARHDVTLPFTRFLAGHADYTPMHFGDRRRDTTWAHQIASAAIFTSPLLTYAAQPKAILENPAVDVIKAIPSVWDETVVLPQSEIGEVAAFARRKGTTWFVAVMAGTEARVVTVSLPFLGAGPYAATIVRDDQQNPAAVEIEKTTLRRDGNVALALRPGGGAIVRLTR